MNKSELIKAVVEKKSYRTRAGEVEEIVNATLDTIREKLANGEDIKITDFGSFKVEVAAARTGRNPHTGEAIEIPEGKRVKFKPSKALKEAVN
jgi:DNA-binding protein HU-beta